MTLHWNLAKQLSGIGLLLVLSQFAHAEPPPPVVCPAGGPIGSVDLRIRSVRGSDETVPLRTVNRLEEGDTILYRPILRSGEDRKGMISMVLVPANRTDGQENLIILEPKSAHDPQEWTVPTRIAVAAFVYGPTGLNRKKVKNFLSRDHDLIIQLADYAEKTAQAEALIAALSSPRSSSAGVQSALQGVSSQYGLTVQLDRTASADQQMMTVFRTLNPAIASYDPIAPQRTQQFSQTAGLATSVAALFFGNPVGLAAGGTAMALQLRSMAFPNAEFRSSFAQSLPGDGLGLCGQRTPAPPHTKVAYLWASRIPNIKPPVVTITGSSSLPAGVRSPLPVSSPDWKFIDRARRWKLLPPDGGPAIPLTVHKLDVLKMLDLDIPADAPEGRYQLAAIWDWDPFTVEGSVEVRRLTNLNQAKLTRASQDALIARSGKVPLTLEGADFEFVSKVQIEKVDDKFSTPAPVPFLLARGLRGGPQDRMDIQINTVDLDPGKYRLTITQADSRAEPVEIRVLPEPPKIENLPFTLHQGTSTGSFLLKGKRLDQIDRIEIAKATVLLEAARPGQTEREMTFKLSPEIAAGTSIAARAYVVDRYEPLAIPDAIRVGGPRPKLVGATVSKSSEQPVDLEPGELPGGTYLSAMLRVENLQSNSTVKLGCEQPNTTTVALQLGQHYGAVSLQQVAADQLYLSFDTGVWFNRCRLQARVVNANEGESEAFDLGVIVRAPHIDYLDFGVDDTATLTGQNLETIERIGWNMEFGEAVSELPLPLSADSKRQTLRVRLSKPPEKESRVYVWLRGETKPRATKVRT